MKYFKSDYHFLAVGDEFTLSAQLYDHMFGIEYILNDVHNLTALKHFSECTEQEFKEGERKVREKLFNAKKLFTPKSFAA